MSIYHIHHIVPRHMGGTDDPSNLIELTITEHAEAHLRLWEEHGSKHDFIAYQCLSGQISPSEAGVAAWRAGVVKGGKQPKSPEWRAKMSAKMKAKYTDPAERQKVSHRHSGKQVSDITRQRLSEARRRTIDRKHRGNILHPSA